MRDPSKQEFLKRGIAREDGQQMALLVAVQKWLIVKYLTYTASIENSSMQFRIRESSGTRKNIDNSLIFLAKYWRSVYFPHFRNSCFEGSLKSGISILRDPSFWEFLFWGIPHFRNFGTGMKLTGFFIGFLPVFCFFTYNLYVKCRYCKIK